MQSTIETIAQIAGVSRGTVDRALHGRSGVNLDVARKILKIADELGYKPNLAAKVLADKQYKQVEIGVILVTENNPFFDTVIEGVQKAIYELGGFGISGKVYLLEKYSEDDELNLINELVQQGVSGLVLKPIVSSKIEDKLEELTHTGIPVVTLNSDIASRNRLAYVGSDLRKSGSVMAELLSMFVHEQVSNVGMIMGSEKNAGMKERMTGFQKYTVENKVNYRIIYETWTNEGADEVYGRTREILEMPEKVDYICVMGGGVSGCIRAVRECKTEQRPHILTYDLIDEVKSGIQEGIVVASITQDPEQQGYLAYQILAKYLAFGQNPQEDVNYTSLAVKLRSCL